MKRLNVFLIIIMSAFFSCDFSALFGSKEILEKFAVLEVDNPILNADYHAVIDHEKKLISIQLPYDVIAGKAALKTRVESAIEGTTYSPDPADSFTYGDEFSLTVYPKDGESVEYTVFPSVDPQTMTFLKVAQPFYVNAEGYEIPIEDYSVSYENDQVILDIDYQTFEEVRDRRIGFASIYVPYNVMPGNDLAYGKIMPYTAEIVSADGTCRKEYSIMLSNQANTSNRIVSVKARVSKIYDYQDVSVCSTDLEAWKGENIQHHERSSEYSQYVSAYVNFGIDAGILKNASFFIEQITMPLSSSGIILTALSDSYRNQNISIAQQLNSVGIQGESGTLCSDLYEIAVGTTFSNSFSYTPPDPEVYSRIDSVRFRQTFRMYYGSSTTSWTTYFYAWSDFNHSIVDTRTYTPRPYIKVHGFIVEAPEQATFDNIVLFSTAESVTEDGNFLHITMKDLGYVKVTGIVSIFDIVSETGDAKTWFIYIEE